MTKIIKKKKLITTSDSIDLAELPENDDDLLFSENDMNIGPFVNLLTDFGFKKVLGQEVSKKHLIRFLNLLIFANSDEKIKTITFLPPEELGEYESERKAIFDLKCTTNKDEIIIVEMQRAQQQYFTGRSTYYGSKAIVNQAVKGVWNFKLNKVYVVSILNFELEKSKKVITHTKQIDTKNPDIDLGYNEYFYIELPKFTKKLRDCENEMEQWIYIFKNMGLLRDAPKDLRVHHNWREFFELANLPNESSAEYKGYLKELQTAVEKRSVELARIENLTKKLQLEKKQRLEIEQATKKTIAEKEIILQESKKMLQEKNKAEEERNKAEEEKNKAEEERNKAEEEKNKLEEQLNLAEITAIKNLLNFGITTEQIIQKYSNFTESDINLLKNNNS